MSLLYVLLLCLPAMTYAVDFKPYNLTATLMFLDIDKDINGIIDRNEIDLSFRHFDTNNNGRISRLEYTAYVTTNEPTLSPVAHALYDVYDVDNDDQLDHHDFDNFFALMDSDGDHRVTHFEFVRYWTILLADLEHLGNA
ncbi:uncharacterized protein LOC106062862 [Biomphalaria glabrata]|uniref:Uncharacterized protein LOC106062862 n=2 Tax=Biomphalaria glabrata TaxID=6526 RepID=A0A9W2YDA9_BIOGL|nr:uncharacterized protein LOC106062862 [Biomphalaria glabrata]